MDKARDRLGEAWRDLHEAVYYAADATGCAQFIQFADLRARRGNAAADIESLQCIQKTGGLTGGEVRQYERLDADHTRLIQAAIGDVPDAHVDRFVSATQELEQRIWRVIPDDKLPGSMFTRVNDPTSGQAHLVRKNRRGGTSPS